MPNSIYRDILPLRPAQCSTRIVYHNIAVVALKEAMRQVYFLTGREPHVEVWGRFYETDNEGELANVLYSDTTLPGMRLEGISYNRVWVGIVQPDGHTEPSPLVPVRGVLDQAQLQVAWS